MQDSGTSITRSLAATRGATERALRAIRQLIGPRGRSIALATLAIASFATPAAAQSGSEAVVCVGSERRTLATNPIRRVYTEDMEIVYRIGADIGQRDQVERDLSSDLGTYPEVWCAWSDPGDDHAVIISYTGVIREDLTVDPEDPRFQAFSVGFGTDFDAAEMQATTTNHRFSTYSDGSGFEVLLRETWSVADGSVAEGPAVVGGEPGISPPDGPICTGRASSEGCWAEISNHPGCYLWNPGPREGFSANWSGECVEGFAEGRGEVAWRWNDGSATDSGLLRGGRREGFHVIDWSTGERYEGSYENNERQGTWTIFHPEGRDDNVVREVGPYVNGELHGTWTGYDVSGNVVGTLRFENGRQVGGSEESRIGRQWRKSSVRRIGPIWIGRASSEGCWMKISK